MKKNNKYKKFNLSTLSIHAGQKKIRTIILEQFLYIKQPLIYLRIMMKQLLYLTWILMDTYIAEFLIQL